MAKCYQSLNLLRMTHVNGFVAELVRAANEVEKLGGYEQRRLLRRSIDTILDMREQIGAPRTVNGRDALTDLRVLLGIMDRLSVSPDESRAGLLKAAAMIRDLYIVIDTGTKGRI